MIENSKKLDVSLFEPNDIGFIYYLKFKGVVIYIGQTTSLYRRILSHKVNKIFDELYVAGGIPKSQLTILENEEIKKYNPILNRTSIDKRHFQIIEGFVVFKKAMPSSCISLDKFKTSKEKPNILLYEWIDSTRKYNCFLDIEKLKMNIRTIKVIIKPERTKPNYFRLGLPK